MNMKYYLNNYYQNVPSMGVRDSSLDRNYDLEPPCDNFCYMLMMTNDLWWWKSQAIIHRHVCFLQSGLEVFTNQVFKELIIVIFCLHRPQWIPMAIHGPHGLIVSDGVIESHRGSLKAIENHWNCRKLSIYFFY